MNALTTFIRLVWGAWLSAVAGTLLALAVYVLILFALRAWLPEEPPVRRYDNTGMGVVKL